MHTPPGLSAEKYKALVALMGGDEEVVREFLASVAQTDKAARLAGVTYKAGPAAMPPALAAALTRLRATLGDVQVAQTLMQLAEQAELKQREAARAQTKAARSAARASLADEVMRAASKYRP